MRKSIQLAFFLNLCHLIYMREFKPCELGRILHEQRLDYSKLNDWMCLIHVLNPNYNSSLIMGHDTNSDNNLQYGMFQIANYYYCWDIYKQKNNYCNLNCTDLIDDSLVDDIRCAKLIYRTGNYSFSHWDGWDRFCNNTDTPNFLEGCDVLNGQPPKIVTTKTNLTLTPSTYLQGSLCCKVKGSPNVTMQWFKNYKKLDPSSPLYEFQTGFDVTSNLSLSIIRMAHNVTEATVDLYKCEASNDYGIDERNYFVKVKDDDGGGGHDLKTTLLVAGATAVIIVTLCIIIGRLLFREQGGLSRAEIKAFENGTQCTGTSEYIHENIVAEPYGKNFEIRESDFRIDKTKILGSGQYGIVYKGTYNEKPVAIKTIKFGAGKTYLQALLVELKVMIFVRGHPNIVNLIGACTRDLDKGRVFIIVELCAMGSLLDYLKQYRERLSLGTHYVQIDTDPSIIYRSQTPNGPGDQEIGERQMMSWSYQLANVMEYLASKKVIHGDIACRNILMLNSETIKLTDFGLSRKLYDYASFIKMDQEPLPWRWLAIETLQDNKFSTASDVWSYGITLWEIFSFGQVPYPGLNWSLDFIQRVEAGLRMTKPDTASEPIFNIMRDCWDENPDERPSFTKIRGRLYQELKKFSIGEYVDLDLIETNSQS